jgi:hypothetical protein
VSSPLLYIALHSRGHAWSAMPGRTTHLACTYKYARMFSAEPPEGAFELIETLIDHPYKVRRLLVRAYRVACEGRPVVRPCNLLGAIVSGFRVRGVGTHDWASRSGQEVLRFIIRNLWGSGLEWVVDLHNALDCLEQGGVQCRLVDMHMLEWTRSHCY